MELRHLLALEAVLTTGSFTAAAAARHVSQPALWAQIKDVERDLGLALFVRSGRGVVPTAACAALRPSLRVALDDVSELRRVAGEIRQGWDAPARIGCAPSHVSHFLAGCIKEVADRDPRAPFPVVVPVTSGSAVEALARGRVDLLVEPRRRRADAESMMLYRVHTVAVGPCNASARGARLDIRALDRQPLATMPADSFLRRGLDEASAAAGITLRVVHESRDASALLALARVGLCTAVLHDEMLDEAEARAATQLVVKDAVLAVPLWLAWRPEASLSPAARTLRDVMCQRARARTPGSASRGAKKTA